MELSLLIDKVTTLSPVSLAIALIAVVATIAYFTVANKGLPPGPTGLPFLGYWPFLGTKTCHLQMEDFKKKYGDVFSFTSSGRLYINMGTAKAIREAHLTKGDCFGARVSDYSLLSRSFEDGVSICNGEAWRVLRKYFLQILKERGLTSMKDNLSGSMQDSINATLDHLRSKNGEPVNMLTLFTDKCNAILRQTLFGESGVTEEKVRDINEHYGALSGCMTPTNLILSGNFARVLFNLMPSTRNGLRSLEHVEKVIYEMIDEHKSSYNEDHMRDIIDEYLKERNLRQSKGDPTAVYFTDKALMASLVQFMGDGVLAVAAFVAFFMKSITDHPEEGERIYEELVEVVGLDRQPTIEDKSKLTYTNAFMLEVLRTTDLLPFFPSQECITPQSRVSDLANAEELRIKQEVNGKKLFVLTDESEMARSTFNTLDGTLDNAEETCVIDCRVWEETTLRGFRIPVGAITLINTYSVHYDPEVYQEPEKFNPSRYISKDEKKREELPVTFGIGKRACLGEGFAMMQVFLFLTTLVKNFHFTMSMESDDVFADMLQGKLQMCAHPRNQKLTDAEVIAGEISSI